MILYINVFIVNNKDVKQYERGKLVEVINRLDIFKYSLYSYASIPWKKVFVNYELDSEYINKYEELNELIEELFDEPIIKNTRVQYQKEWLKEIDRLKPYKNEFIWYQCNDDHIFVDKDLDVLNSMLYEMDSLYKYHKYITCTYSHWQEMMLYYYTKELIKNDNNFFVLRHNYEFATTSIQIVTYDFFVYWWISEEYGDEYWFPRSDPPGGVKSKKIKNVNIPDEIYTVVPKREIVRHFDVYSHANISYNIVPPMTIPNGFFDKKIVIKYGFDQRDDEFYNINPKLDYKVNNEMGTDDKYLLEELPFFWKKHIYKVIENKTPDDLVYYRNLNLLKILYWKVPRFVTIEEMIKIFKIAFIDPDNISISIKNKLYIYAYAFLSKIKHISIYYTKKAKNRLLLFLKLMKNYLKRKNV